MEAASSLATIFHAAVKGRTTSHYSDCFSSTQRWPRAYDRRISRPREDAATSSAPSDGAVDNNFCIKKQRRSRASPAGAHSSSQPAPACNAPLPALAVTRRVRGRREKNRASAQQSRQRKKCHLETLEQRVEELEQVRSSLLSSPPPCPSPPSFTANSRPRLRSHPHSPH